MGRALSAAALLAFAALAASAEPKPLPSREARAAIIAALKAEVERMDGDGLLPRANRPVSWEKTVAALRAEAAAAETPQDFGRVLKRFDAAIPNLHMKSFLDLDYEPYTAAPRSWDAAPESVDGERRPARWRITRVSSAAWPGGSEPRPGDELLAINGRPMAGWSDENFSFCDYPLRGQCERELLANLDAQRLSWKRTDPLLLRLRRGGRAWEVAAPPLPFPPAEPESKPWRLPRCGVEEGRYPGFEPVHLGAQACVFGSKSRPGVFVLRIRSFRYEHDEDEDIDSIHKELRRLYDGFWKARSGEIETLVVDVIGNGGGTDPISYYKLLFSAPFQEQYVQYRKISDLAAGDERAGRLWDSVWAQEGWRARLREDGRWAATPVGGFLPPRPQFCADRDCAGALFEPLEHDFRGRVLLMMNRRCVSSCVGFVWNLVDVLKGRVRTFGEPDSGDSTFARLFLDVIPDPADPRGFRTRVRNYHSNPRELGDALFRQIVSVTRSTDARGRVISGVPQRIDVRVPARWDQSEEQWSAAVFAAALAEADRRKN